MRRQRWKHIGALTATLLAVSIYYAIVAQEMGRFHLERPGGGYYPLLVESFMHGRLSLLAKPSPAMLHLQDPQDARANDLYRLHDASLYEREYYLYYGLAPLAVMLPYRLITGHNMPESFAEFLFAFGVVMMSALLLFMVWSTECRAAPFGFVPLSIMAFSLSGGIPYVLTRPWFYELAETSGMFFAFAALLFIYLALKNASKRISLWLILAGLCLGLAVAGRPPLVLFGIFIPKTLWDLKRKGVIKRRSQFIGRSVEMMVPWITVGVVLAVYNYARFGSVTDFGMMHSLPAFGFHPLFDWARVPNNFVRYLFSAPEFVNQFPYVQAASELKSPWAPIRAVYVEYYPFVGFIWTFPFLLVAAIAARKVWSKANIKATPLLFETRQLVINMVMAFSIVFLFMLLFASTANRYLIEFTPYLLLAALITWLAFETDKKQIQNQGDREARRFAGVALLLLGSLAGFLIGLGGNGESRFNSTVRAQLEHLTMHPLEAKSPYDREVYAHIETSAGVITCLLFEKEVPKNVLNFIELAEGKKEWVDIRDGAKKRTPFYQNRNFYRVTPGYLIEAGGQTSDGFGDPGYLVQPEWRTRGLHSKSGNCMMADYTRYGASSQIAVSLAPTPWLEDRAVIIGRVVEGIEVAQRISEVTHDAHDYPIQPVTIKNITFTVKAGTP